MIEPCPGKLLWCQTPKRTAKDWKFLVFYRGRTQVRWVQKFLPSFLLPLSPPSPLPPSLPSLSHLVGTYEVPGTVLGFGAVKVKPSRYSHTHQSSGARETCHDRDTTPGELGMGWGWKLPAKPPQELITELTLKAE